MTTLNTSAVRAWARDNGFEIAERGRLPLEVTSAYAEAHRSGAGQKATTRKPAAARNGTAKNGAAKNGTAKNDAATNGTASNGAGRSASGTSTPSKAAAQRPAEAPDRAPTPDSPPTPTPSPVADDRRLVALGEELAALSDRVTALEAALNNGGKSKAIRFRRRS